MYKSEAISIDVKQAENDKTEPHFKPRLGLLDSTMIVAGSMIGSGIFIVSAPICLKMSAVQAGSFLPGYLQP